MTHHTKTKGDIAIPHAMADLAEKGWDVFIPISEHLPFDIAAYKDGKFVRVQVKYRSARAGLVEVRFRSNWTDRHGTHTNKANKADIDVYCVWCPETRECYYIDPNLFGESVTLRIARPKNNQTKNVKMAHDYKEMPK